MMADKGYCWVAARRIKVTRNGKNVWLEPGEHVPEAESWQHTLVWEEQGHIRKDYSGKVESKPKAVYKSEGSQETTPKAASKKDAVKKRRGPRKKSSD